MSMEEAQRRVRLQRASLGTAKSVAWPSTITEEDRISMTGSSVEGRSSAVSSNMSLGDGGERLCSPPLLEFVPLVLPWHVLTGLLSQPHGARLHACQRLLMHHGFKGMSAVTVPAKGSISVNISSMEGYLSCMAICCRTTGAMGFRGLPAA